MKQTSLATKALNRIILDLMDKIEDKTNKMFHEIDSNLDKRIFEAIDSKNIFKLNLIIRELENLSLRL